MRRKLRSLGQTLAAVLVWLAVWQAAAMALGRTVLLPTVGQTLQYLLSHVGDGVFWHTIAFSLLRIVAGYLLALAVGALLGVGTAKCTLLDVLLRPLLGVIRATPVASFIILVLVWLQRQSIPVFISFLIVLPGVWANVYTGMKQIDPKLLEMTHAFAFTRRNRYLGLYLPTVRPYFRAAAINGLGMAWKAGIAAEVLCTPAFAIGTQLYHAKVYLETTQLFAWTLVVVVLSFLIEHAVSAALQYWAKRTDQA